MYFVYILKSLNFSKHYTGSTQDVEKRLKRHNAGGSIWTKRYKPWVIVYTEQFESRIEAEKREREIKSYKSGSRFKKLINNIAGMAE